jgi:hypothetical protein
VLRIISEEDKEGFFKIDTLLSSVHFWLIFAFSMLRLISLTMLPSSGFFSSRKSSSRFISASVLAASA